MAAAARSAIASPSPAGETGGFHGVVGVELLDAAAALGLSAPPQDSSADNPTTDYPIARRNFLRTDEDNDYLDPGPATCDLARPSQRRAPPITAAGPEYGYDIDS